LAILTVFVRRTAVESEDKFRCFFNLSFGFLKNDDADVPNQI
jgi:hypothetical protein